MIPHNHIVITKNHQSTEYFIMQFTITSSVRLNFRAPNAPLATGIRYAIGECSEGALLVARGNYGICAIFMADQVEQLRTQTARAFPQAPLEDATAALHHDLQQVGAFIDEPGSDLALDVTVGGTTFQQRVWHALSEIPAGLTRSYADVAEILESPDSIRAVAAACAANVLAVAIPCHRVVRSDGSISGYRWGVERKRSLLNRERLQ